MHECVRGPAAAGYIEADSGALHLLQTHSRGLQIFPDLADAVLQSCTEFDKAVALHAFMHVDMAVLSLHRSMLGKCAPPSSNVQMAQSCQTCNGTLLPNHNSFQLCSLHNTDAVTAVHLAPEPA